MGEDAFSGADLVDTVAAGEIALPDEVVNEVGVVKEVLRMCEGQRDYAIG